MKRLEVARMILVLALASSVDAFVEPGHCAERSDASAKDGTSVPHWAFTDNLHKARFNHTATLLSNGKVLLAGGENAGTTVGAFDNSAELCDPSQGTWSVTGSLKVGRTGHTATRLRNGKVLVVGGIATTIDGAAVASAELYDPVNGTWSSTGSLGVARVGHTATLLPNGKVLILGGTGDYDPIHAAELYDPVTGAWTAAAKPSWNRWGHTATLLKDGTVLVFGGIVGDYDPDFEFPAASAPELYDPSTDSWKRVGAQAIAYGHTATLLQNGKVLIDGGQYAKASKTAWAPRSAELYDPTVAAWTYTGSPAITLGGPASLLPNGKVLATGGDTAELYDPDTGRWTPTAALNAGRDGHSATLLLNGRVLVAGGSAMVGGLRIARDSAELYDAALPAGTINPAFTGAWFDPAQSGQGLIIEVLPDNQLLAGWFTFNPAGTQQTWFMGVGTYSGNTATVTAVDQPSGGRFIPNFDPTRVTHSAWGTLTFTFEDCNHGKVDFNSVLGYGSGSMSLTRLTQPAELTCP